MTTAFSTIPPTRITLLDGSGGNVSRWTFQSPDDQGRVLRWVAEGKMNQLGSAFGFAKVWKQRGFRIELGLQWAYGLTSLREAWETTTWGAPSVLPTAQAHLEALEWGAQFPVLVEPFVGTPAPSFHAQTFERGPSLRDTKGVAHARLELVLRASILVPQISLSVATGGWGLGPFGLLPWGD